MKCFYCGTEPNNATTKKELKVCCCYRLYKIGNKYEQHYSCKADEEKAKAVSKMPDKKITDSEIPDIKELLEYKVKVDCQNCDLTGEGCCSTCVNSLIEQFIELFNRLQAENERLKEENENLRDSLAKKKFKDEMFEMTLGEYKAKAYKEFAERLKMRAINRYNEYDNQEFPYATITHIDNLLNKLVGEDNV